jgi:hypothetical protein
MSDELNSERLLKEKKASSLQRGLALSIAFGSLIG